jgi:small GTP-binding protein
VDELRLTAAPVRSSNQVALLTPVGVGAIAVVRLRGAALQAFIESHLSKRPRVGRCVHSILRDREGREIDDPVIVLHPDELTLDLSLHGGEWVVRECLELVESQGFALVPSIPHAQAPIIEQEMLTALPVARTEQVLRILLAQANQWQRLERGELDREAMRKAVNDHSLWWMLAGPRVAIVGAANVGKSTLANQLFGQERSITADIPGTTRDWVGDWANLDGLPVMLLDTPGQRHSTDFIEQAAIRQSAEPIKRADLVIVVLDPSRPLEPEQADIVSRFPRCVTVINKSDLPAAWDAAHIPDAIHTVATSGKGIDMLRRRIRDHFGCDSFDPARPRWWTQRQYEVLRHMIGG